MPKVLKGSKPKKDVGYCDGVGTWSVADCVRERATRVRFVGPGSGRVA